VTGVCVALNDCPKGCPRANELLTSGFMYQGQYNCQNRANKPVDASPPFALLASKQTLCVCKQVGGYEDVLTSQKCKYRRVCFRDRLPTVFQLPRCK